LAKAGAVKADSPTDKRVPSLAEARNRRERFVTIYVLLLLSDEQCKCAVDRFSPGERIAKEESRKHDECHVYGNNFVKAAVECVRRRPRL
jgi:hypothetical protein